MDKQPVFKFHVLSLGESTQRLGESNNFINRPFLQIDDLRKKWGDEYIVINSPLGEIDNEPKTYLGCIDLDKKHRKYLKLFKELDFPIDNPDYYVLHMNVIGEKIDKVQSFFKHNKDSLSCILSCAYNKDESDIYTSKLIVICQNGDGIMIDGDMLIFSDLSNKFEEEI